MLLSYRAVSRVSRSSELKEAYTLAHHARNVSRQYRWLHRASQSLQDIRIRPDSRPARNLVADKSHRGRGSRSTNLAPFEQHQGGPLEQMPVSRYQNLVKEGHLSTRDGNDYSELLFRQARRITKRQNFGQQFSSEKEALADLARMLEEHTRRGIFEKPPLIAANLILYHLECGQYNDDPQSFQRARDLFEWATDPAHPDRCSIHVYSAFLRVKAAQGDDIDDCEKLFHQALQRYPGDFAAYHLSPGAIVPDRNLPIRLRGLSSSLLSGLNEVYFAGFQLQKFFLNLDTALRLWPDSCSRTFFMPFFSNSNKWGATLAIMTACRSGIPLPSSYVEPMLQPLTATSSTEHSLDQLRQCLASTQRAFESCLLFNITGNTPDGIVGQWLFRTFGKIYRNISSLDISAADQRALMDRITSWASTLLQNLESWKVRDPSPMYTAFLKEVVPHSNDVALLGRMVETIERSNRGPKLPVWIAVMAASGGLDKKELFMVAWSKVLENCKNRPKFNAWWSFIDSASRCGLKPYALAEIEKHKHRYDETWAASISSILAKEDAERQSVQVSAEELAAITQCLENHISSTNEKFQEASRADCSVPALVKDLSFSEIEDEFASRGAAHGESMKEIYDTFTTDGSNSPGNVDAPAQHEADSSSMQYNSLGISFAELRYQHWWTINALLVRTACAHLRYLWGESMKQPHPPAPLRIEALLRLSEDEYRRASRPGGGDEVDIDTARESSAHGAASGDASNYDMDKQLSNVSDKEKDAAFCRAYEFVQKLNSVTLVEMVRLLRTPTP